MHKIDRYLINDIHLAWLFSPIVAIIAFVAMVVWWPDHGYEDGVKHSLPDPATRICYDHEVQGGWYCEDVNLDVSKLGK